MKMQLNKNSSTTHFWVLTHQFTDTDCTASSSSYIVYCSNCCETDNHHKSSFSQALITTQRS